MVIAANFTPTQLNGNRGCDLQRTRYRAYGSLVFQSVLSGGRRGLQRRVGLKSCLIRRYIREVRGVSLLVPSPVIPIAIPGSASSPTLSSCSFSAASFSSGTSFSASSPEFLPHTSSFLWRCVTKSLCHISHSVCIPSTIAAILRFALARRLFLG